MSDLGGIGGALLLSDQISTNRLFDSFRRAREANNLALNDAAWRNQYNDLVNRYNALARDANRLADVQDRRLSNQNQHIKDLEATNAMLATEVAQLKYDLANSRSAVEQLRTMIRTVVPEAFRPIL
jgi:chromosome condensin MukBEF ATPase and DNA-binding subunit MukB